MRFLVNILSYLYIIFNKYDTPVSLSYSFLKKVKNKILKYQYSITVFISKDRLLYNIQRYRDRYRDFQYSPVLKSNAYGHGLLEVASILKDEKSIPFFCVDSLYEAGILRKSKIKKDILILGYTDLNNILKFNYDRYIFNIISLEDLRRLSDKKYFKKIRIHLKIDTGMGRQGILLSQVDEVIALIKKSRIFDLEGICSHFADADSEDKNFTDLQIKNWKSVVQKFKKEDFKKLKYFHIAASSGVDVIDKDYTNLVRLGVGLYGINVSQDNSLDLKPIMRVESILSSIKSLKAGQTIGYNHTYILSEDKTVATVPIGYFEGVDRRLSNIGFFKYGEVFLRLLGRISMNITTIDVSSIKEVAINDPVIVISEDKCDKNSIENIAKMCNTIPYEIMVHIGQNLKRVVIDDFNK